MEEFLALHRLTGLAMGICTFLIIGLFHPIIIKAEYYLGVRCWWMFLISGAAGIVLSVVLDGVFWPALCGVFAFSSLWSIKEVFEQKRRVEKGWFPANPKKIKTSKNSTDLYR